MSWRAFLTLAAIVFVGVLLEVSLIYVGRRSGGLAFSFSLRPTMEVF